MRYSIGKSHNSQVESCVSEVTAKFKNPKLILFFSPVQHFEEYAQLIHSKFPESISMGMTTIVSLSKEGADKNALMAVGIEEGIRCSADVLEHVDRYPIRYVERVIKCADQIGTNKNTVCLEFTTALLCAEESVLSTLNSVLLDRGIQVFGGTAGDDGSASGTKVALNGVVREKSTVFALIHNERGAIRYYRENIYSPIPGSKMISTKVDMATRKVIEFDHEPAAKAYARTLGISEAEITRHFDTNPVGRVVGDDIFITANCTLEKDKSIIYHARVYNNSNTVVLERDDYKAVNQETMGKIKKENPNPSFAIMCNCLARSLMFEGDGYIQEFARKAGNTLGDYVGFSGYGEQLGQHHFNMTMVIAVFE